MKSDIQHSPLPWSFEHREHGTARHMAIVVTAEGYYVDCTQSGVGFEGDCANAEFIVRACNSHADLLAALKELAEACDMDFECEADDDEHVGGGEDGPMALTFGMIRRAKAAIAKAEGK